MTKPRSTYLCDSIVGERASLPGLTQLCGTSPIRDNAGGKNGNPKREQMEGGKSQEKIVKSTLVEHRGTKE